MKTPLGHTIFTLVSLDRHLRATKKMITKCLSLSNEVKQFKIDNPGEEFTRNSRAENLQSCTLIYEKEFNAFKLNCAGQLRALTQELSAKLRSF